MCVEVAITVFTAELAFEAGQHRQDFVSKPPWFNEENLRR